MFEISEFLLRFFEGLASLRFLVSASYRKKTRERWRGSSWISNAMDLFGGIVGLTMIVLLILLLFGYFGNDNS